MSELRDQIAEATETVELEWSEWAGDPERWDSLPSLGSMVADAVMVLLEQQPTVTLRRDLMKMEESFEVVGAIQGTVAIPEYMHPGIKERITYRLVLLDWEEQV